MIRGCSSVDRKVFLHETAHSKICGLSSCHDFSKGSFFHCASSSSIMFERRQTFLQPLSSELNNSHSKSVFIILGLKRPFNFTVTSL